MSTFANGNRRRDAEGATRPLFCFLESQFCSFKFPVARRSCGAKSPFRTSYLELVHTPERSFFPAGGTSPARSAQPETVLAFGSPKLAASSPCFPSHPSPILLACTQHSGPAPFKLQTVCFSNQNTRQITRDTRKKHTETHRKITETHGNTRDFFSTPCLASVFLCLTFAFGSIS